MIDIQSSTAEIRRAKDEEEERKRKPKKGTAVPPFSVHNCCGQTAGWIKMPLGTEVDPGHIVLDGDPVAPPKAAQHPPLFSPCLLWPNGRPS